MRGEGRAHPAVGRISVPLTIDAVSDVQHFSRLSVEGYRWASQVCPAIALLTITA